MTFGCQMNVHDSQRIETLMRAAGYDVSDEVDGADVIVLNTCSVREAELGAAPAVRTGLSPRVPMC